MPTSHGPACPIRARALGGVMAVAFGAIAACSASSSSAQSVAGLEVIMTTQDLKVTADIDSLRLELIQLGRDGSVTNLLDQSYALTSTGGASTADAGALTLPATFTIKSGHGSNQEVLVVVTGYKGTGAVVLRQALVTVPSDRLASLWMVLSSACLHDVTLLPVTGAPTSTCAAMAQDCLPTTGSCTSYAVNSTKLVTYAAGQELTTPDPRVLVNFIEPGAAGVTGPDAGATFDGAGAPPILDAGASEESATADTGADTTLAETGTPCANACTAGTTACLLTSSTQLQSCAAGANGCTTHATSECAAGLVCERAGAAACVDPAWAQWPAPNSKVDVTAGAPNLESYTDNGDQTVTDNITHLVWQKDNAPMGQGYTQTAAVTYCAGLALGGGTDWRLPSQVELLSLLDLGASGPAIDTTYFPATAAGNYWSSTPFAGSSGSGWVVSFNNGSAGYLATSLTDYARCVR